MRLCTNRFAPEVLDKVMGTLFTSAVIPAPANNKAQPLFNYAEEVALELRRGLPVFDEWGIVPSGHRGPRGNPWAAELEQMDESPEADEVEESGEGEASRSTDPLGGPASSARSASPEGDPQVISSSSDEDPSRGAPSRSTAEEEEEESGAKGGRREPRSKSAHDKDAVAARAAPCEGAGAPQGGAKAHSP